MPTKEQILHLVSEGASYDTVGRKLGIPPGQAYLIATGLPADGSDGMSPEERHRPGIRLGSVQALVNPPVHPSSKSDEAMDWLKSRIAADPEMRDAARRRDAAPPEPEVPEDEDEVFDVVDVLGRDHNQVKYLLEELEALPKHSKTGSEVDAERRQSVLDMMIAALSGHEAAEEAFFWPSVKGWLGPDGDELARQATTQEQQAKETIAALEGRPGTDEQFDELTSKLSTQLAKHVAFEDRVFLRVKEATTTEQRVEVGRKVSKAERRGPTHAHPKAGSSRAATKVGPAVGLVDKVRDAVSGRPAERQGQSSAESAGETG
jgi:hypothetical protein